MNIIGGFVLVMGFFGKRYQQMYDESAMYVGSNPKEFASLADQKSSGVTGFLMLLVGFIEQAIPYIPYRTTLSDTSVALIMGGIDIGLLVGLFTLKVYMTRFYLGLYRSTRWKDNDYIQTLLTRSLPTNSIEFLEQQAKRNLKLYWNISQLGKGE